MVLIAANSLHGPEKTCCRSYQLTKEQSLNNQNHLNMNIELLQYSHAAIVHQLISPITLECIVFLYQSSISDNNQYYYSFFFMAKVSAIRVLFFKLLKLFQQAKRPISFQHVHVLKCLPLCYRQNTSTVQSLYTQHTSRQGLTLDRMTGTAYGLILSA